MPTYLRMFFSLGYFTCGCLAMATPLLGFTGLLTLAALDSFLSIAYNG